MGRIALRPEVELWLERVESVSWFGSVGTPHSEAAEVVKGWDVAFRLIREPSWTAFRMAARNALTELLFAHHRVEDSKWNDYTGALRPRIERLAPNIVAGLPNTAMRGQVVDAVKWDLLATAMEFQYTPFHAFEFYPRLCEWYLRGHLPCGWKGAPETGRAIVY